MCSFHLEKWYYLCCLHHQAHPIFRKLIGQLLGGVGFFLFMVREKDKPNFSALGLNLLFAYVINRQVLGKNKFFLKFIQEPDESQQQEKYY
ncbi:hypothetical protein NIES298_15030 [Microcystis aeruginosa NIES-298]|nr:hypothetical protein NIES298_15030 [Microcystis aeruginosa NIES-298]